jgi:hypothetical protein
MSTLFVNNLNTATGTTITIPTGKKLVVTDTGGLAVPGTVVQVIQSVNNTVETFSTTETWTDISNMSVTITPTSTSSKIMIDYTIHNSTSDATTTHRIVRGSTAIGLGSASGSRQLATSRTGRMAAGDENHINGPTTMKYIDSPSTTSATTYKLQLRIQTGEGAITTNTSQQQPNNTSTYGSRVISTITVTEIAG